MSEWEKESDDGTKENAFPVWRELLIGKMRAKDRWSGNKMSLYLIYRPIMILSPRVISQEVGDGIRKKRISILLE